MTTSRKTLLDAFQAAVDEGVAAFFVGAGFSRPAGFVNWRGLIRDIAEELHLDVDREADLIALAQYHVNQKRGRAAINTKLVEEFTKDAVVTENHRQIASLPVSVVWTTNYDTLIEDAFREAHKRADVKVSPISLATTKPKRDVTIYKMHGDVSSPDEAVLTKTDYETYQLRRNLFSVALQGDLVSKTFLFLGYSFSDPNIDYILARIRGLLGDNKREHFCVMRNIPKPKGRGRARAQYDFDVRKQELRIEDLKNYGIQTHLVEEYQEIAGILRELNDRVNRKNIFVSGSAEDFGPLGKDRLEKLARALGTGIVERGYNLVTGLGLGIGSAVTIGAMEALYRSPASHLDERTTLRPFPQLDPATGTRKALWRRHRQEMIAKAGFAVFLSGNKRVGTALSMAEGVREEFEIAVDRGVYPIPVGATGHVAHELWTAVTANSRKYFGSFKDAVAKPLAKLNDAALSNDELLEAVFSIVKTIAPK